VVIRRYGNLPYPDHIQLLGLQSLECRRVKQDLLSVYKIIHGLNNSSISMYYRYSIKQEVILINWSKAFVRIIFTRIFLLTALLTCGTIYPTMLPLQSLSYSFKCRL